MSDLYKRLNLRRESIIQAIEYYLQMENYEYTVANDFVAKGETRNRINMEVNGKAMYIDVHFNADGTTTLEDFGGNNSELKGVICEFVKKNCEISDGEQNQWFVVNGVSESDFLAVVELVNESQYCKELVKEQPEKYLYQYKGLYGEKMTLQYFNQRDDKILVQGKPLLLFMETTEIVTNLVDYEDIPKVLNTNYMVHIDEDNIIEQTKIIMKNSYDTLWSPKLKKCVLQAVYDMNLDGKRFDYTGLVFHSYRAMEGHLRHVLFQNGITLNTPGFCIFDSNKKLETKYRTAVMGCYTDVSKANTIITYIEKAYKYFRDKRHVYFHWNNPNPTGLDDTPVIEDRDTARGLIRESLEYIDEYFGLI